MVQDVCFYLEKLGVKIVKYKNIYHVYGNGLGSFKTQNNLTINAGNSGTLARLLMGLLTTYPHKIKIIGDKSLSKRPMGRIIAPLEKFGVTFEPKDKKTLPFYIIGSEMPIAISHEEKIGSAQVKSSIILASLNTPGITKIKELKKSRDHTENMLKFIRAKIKIKKFKTYNLISIEGQRDFKAFDLNIPGDISSAAFFIVLTLLAKHSIIKIKNINLNPTRTGIIISGPTNLTVSQRVESNPPASQNIIWRWASISPEKRTTAEIIEFRKAPIAIPAKRRVGTETPPPEEAIKKTSIIATRDPTNANPGIAQIEYSAAPVDMAITAPTAPPAETPIIPGSAILFRKTPCIITPAAESPPPTSNAIVILGIRIFSIIARWVSGTSTVVMPVRAIKNPTVDPMETS